MNKHEWTLRGHTSLSGGCVAEWGSGFGWCHGQCDWRPGGGWGALEERGRVLRCVGVQLQLLASQHSHINVPNWPRNWNLILTIMYKHALKEGIAIHACTHWQCMGGRGKCAMAYVAWLCKPCSLIPRPSYDLTEGLGMRPWYMYTWCMVKSATAHADWHLRLGGSGPYINTIVAHWQKVWRKKIDYN